MVERDSRYDILFEQVRIGPLTTKNRFFQVPHCNGMGHLRPKSLAAMRGLKAEGGWSVVCTEEVYIHSSSENDPLVEGRLWDDRDKNALELMKEFLPQSAFSIKLAKKSINTGYDLDIKTALNIEFKEYIHTLDSKDRVSALKKFKKN